MESLTSPKIIVGLHCLKLRTKGMYIPALVDPDESTFYDKYETSAYWCAMTQTGFGPDREPVRPDSCCANRGCCKH
jgi:hypothetical protein